MAYSTQRVTSDGTLVLLPISIEYFDRSEISVFFDGILNTTDWEWVGSTEKSISFDPVVALDVEVLLKRTTVLGAPRHAFSQGAAFTAESMDEDILQVLHIAQEAREGAGLGEVFQDLDFHGFKAKNVGTAVDSGDAVSLGQFSAHDSTILGYKDAAAASASAAAASAISAAASAASLDTSAFMQKASNLSDVSSAETARTNLGLEIGTNVQAYDSDIPTVSASQAEMEAGTESDLRSMSPLLVKQAIYALANSDLTLGTPVASTSGSSIDFTSIPSWVKRITILFSGVSTNGSSPVLIQIGAGSVDSSGYSSGAQLFIHSGSIVYSNSVTSGLPIESAQANLTSSTVRHGQIVLALAGSNEWTFTANLAHTGTNTASLGAGSKTLSGALDRVRITTVNGTDAFDAGSINITYE